MNHDSGRRDYLLLSKENGVDGLLPSDWRGLLSIDRSGTSGLGDRIVACLQDAGGTAAFREVAMTADRTITAGSANIVVTNGDGVSGNPTIDLGSGITLIGGIRFGGDGTPTYTPRPGAGVGATVTATSGGNLHGDFTLTTGTAPAAGAQIRIDFDAAYANTHYSAQLIPRGPNAAPIDWYTGTRSTGFVEFNFATAPAASTSYTFSYRIMGW